MANYKEYRLIKHFENIDTKEIETVEGDYKDKGLAIKLFNSWNVGDKHDNLTLVKIELVTIVDGKQERKSTRTLVR